MWRVEWYYRGRTLRSVPPEILTLDSLRGMDGPPQVLREIRSFESFITFCFFELCELIEATERAHQGGSVASNSLHNSKKQKRNEGFKAPDLPQFLRGPSISIAGLRLVLAILQPESM